MSLVYRGKTVSAGGSYDKFADIPGLYKPYVEEAKALLMAEYPYAKYTDVIIAERPTRLSDTPFSYLHIYFATGDFTVKGISEGGCGVYGCYLIEGLWSASAKGSVWHWGYARGSSRVKRCDTADKAVYMACGGTDSLGERIVYSSTYIHYDGALLYPLISATRSGDGALTYTWDSETLTLTIYVEESAVKPAETEG